MQGWAHLRFAHSMAGIPLFLEAAPPSAKTPPNVAELIRQCGELLVELRRNLQRAQQRMSESANRHRRQVEFEVGDLVWLKLQPYRQHSVAKPLSAKLARRYYGPFEVLQRIGQVAYRLRLPEGSRIHNVFHVSLLREFVAGEGPQQGVKLPTAFCGDRPIVRPEQILDTQTLWHNGEPVKHVLVKWSDGLESPSWEPLTTVAQRFPNILLEDKETSNGGGVDTIMPDQPEELNTTAIPEEATGAVVEDEVTTAAVEPRKEAVAEEVKPRKEAMAEARNLRPRAQLKSPEKFQHYVAK